GIAARRIPTIGPVERPSGRIDVQIDRLRQIVIEEFDVPAVRGAPASGELDIRAEDAALAGLISSLLSPVEFASSGVYRNTDAPFLEVLARTGIALARIDEGLDIRAIEVGSHHTHAFPVAPVELAALLFELELLRSERAAGRNDSGHVFPVEIRTEDRTIVRIRVAHIGPVHMARGAVDHQAVRKLSAFLDDRLEIGAIGICGEHPAAPQIKKEDAASNDLLGRCLPRPGECCVHRSISFVCPVEVYWLPLHVPRLSPRLSGSEPATYSAAAARSSAFGTAPLACKPSISAALNPSCSRTSLLCSPSAGARFAG